MDDAQDVDGSVILELVTNRIPFESMKPCPANIRVGQSIELRVSGDSENSLLSFIAEFISEPVDLGVVVLDGLIEICFKEWVIKERHSPFSEWPKTSS